MTQSGRSNKMKELKIRVDGGFLVATVSPPDPEYPGIDVEFVADSDAEDNVSLPRVLVEKPLFGTLRVLVWRDPQSEDFTYKIQF